MKKGFKLFKLISSTLLASSPVIVFTTSVKNQNLEVKTKSFWNKKYYYISSASYDEQSSTFLYSKPVAPVNYSYNTKVDENGWAVLDENSFYDFFINRNTATFFAKLANSNPNNKVTLDLLKTIHSNIFNNNVTINLSGFYAHDHYGYITLRALTNPYFAWTLKPDNKNDWGKLYLNLSKNNLVEIPDFSQVLAFDESLYNNNQLPYNNDQYLFEPGRTNKGQWMGINLQNNHLLNIPFSTLPHLFPTITTNSKNVGIDIDFNYMPYLYHDKRIPSTDVDKNRVLPISSRSNRSSIKYTTMYVESSGLTQIVEYLLKIGIYQLDGINYTAKDIYNYLMYGNNSEITSKFFDNVPSKVSKDNQFEKLYWDVTNGIIDASNIDSGENQFFCIINDYLTSNWLVSQSTKYNTINQFFANIGYSGDISANWRNLCQEYDMPIQVMPNDAFGIFSVKALYFASKIEYFDHDIIKQEDIENANLNNIANSIINAFKFNYGNYYVELRGFKIDLILIATYLICFLVIVVTIVSWLLYIYVFKRREQKKHIK